MLKLRLCLSLTLLSLLIVACMPTEHADDIVDQIDAATSTSIHPTETMATPIAASTPDSCLKSDVLQGLKIYYMANLDDGTLYVNTINGNNEQPVWQVKNLKNFDVSPNGERVLGRIADGNEESWVLGDLGASELVRLGDVKEYAWSSDGDALIYFDEDAQELFMIRQGEFEPARLVALSEFDGADTLSVSWPVWSSTEKKAVVFVSALKTSTQGFIHAEYVQSQVILIDADTKDIKTVFQSGNDDGLWDTDWVPDGSKFHILFIRDNPEPKYGIMFQIYDYNGLPLGREQYGMVQTFDYSGNNWVYFDFRDDLTYTIDIPTLIGDRDKVVPTRKFPYDGWLGEDYFYTISDGSVYNNGNDFDFYRISLIARSDVSQDLQRTDKVLSLTSPKIAPDYGWLLTFSNPNLLFNDEGITPRKETTELWVVDSSTEQIFSVHVDTPEPYFDSELFRKVSTYYPDRFEGEFSSDSRYYVFYSIDQDFENTLYVYDHCTRLISMPGLKVNLPEVQVVKLRGSTEMGKFMQGKFDIVWSTR